MKNIAVFCGSKLGAHPIYQEKTKELGQFMAGRQIKIIYGGACIGLMGVLADSAMEVGGHVVGVSPNFLMDKEVHHSRLNELIEVDSMHKRKEKMYALSDAVFILPGGCGTLDEFFEIFTWSQLGLHEKQIFIFNWNNFYGHLLAHMQKMVEEGFLNQEGLDKIQIVTDVSDLIV